MEAKNLLDDTKTQSEVTHHKSPFTSTSSLQKNNLNCDHNLNVDAKPFVPIETIGDGDGNKKDEDNSIGSASHETFTLKIPLTSKIWKNISARSQPKTSRSLIPEPASNRTSSATSAYEQRTPDRSLLVNVLPDGLIHVFRRDNIHIDMSLDRAIRVVFPLQNILIAVSNTASAAAIFHPNGRVVQNSSRVDVVAHDGVRHNNYLRYAKMWYKGISFTAKDIPLVYLVDEAGLRTTVDRFLDIKDEFAFDVFNRNARYGPQYFEESIDKVDKSTYSMLDGSEKLEINQVRIISSGDGTISIQRPNNKCMIRINPRKASLSLTTSTFHCTASMGTSPHLFLRRADRRIHFDGKIFCVRNAGHSAGLNDRNQVTIFNKRSAPTSFEHFNP